MAFAVGSDQSVDVLQLISWPASPQSRRQRRPDGSQAANWAYLPPAQGESVVNSKLLRLASC